MKFTLIGTDNNGFRHRYSFRKTEAFKKSFVKFMENLDFNSKDIKGTFMGYDKDEKLINLKISEFEDCIRYYQNKKYDVDVFYGNKKIIMVVRTKKRIPMVEHLVKKAGWIKPIKIKKIKNKIKPIPLLLRK